MFHHNPLGKKIKSFKNVVLAFLNFPLEQKMRTKITQIFNVFLSMRDSHNFYVDFFTNIHKFLDFQWSRPDWNQYGGKLVFPRELVIGTRVSL